MNVRIKCISRLERDVVRLWRKSGLTQGSIITYLQWVRRFQTYCDLHGLDELSELTLAGAIKFGSLYIGPRAKGPVGESTRFAARNALHAWACALHSLKTPILPWRQKPEPIKLSPLLTEYCRYRRSDCGIAAATLQRDLKTADVFLCYSRKGRTQLVPELTMWILSSLSCRSVSPDERWLIRAVLLGLFFVF